ncbi:putative phage repressor [Solidesulfovibrio fructosivorans JJ]]|uniref:Putative phage repressor n=1 Tax=Solidesulfovibrio fructosivorans JJ] TaxID=596151 RepID=E1JR53_SOLFR|nr:phage repressor protein [Solidesulfovibrio fructosivorans]EFL53054.1 putative phage repressor [Solidesulfovibrio fructosivorans JJ]]
MNEGIPQETINRFDEAFDRIKQATGMRTQVEIAKLLDIRQSSISDAKRRQSIPDSWLIKLYQIYNLNPNWIIDGEQPQFLGEKRGGALHVRESGDGYGRKPKYYQMPVAPMSAPEPEQQDETVTIAETLAVPEQFHKPSLVIVRMDESDMEPVIHRGAYVGIDKDRRTIRSGGLYALDMPMEGLIIKRVVHDAENSRLILRSENQTYADQTIPADGAADRVVGRVTWVFQEL